MRSLITKVATFATIGALALQLATPVAAFSLFGLGRHGDVEATEAGEKMGSRPGLLRNFTANKGKAAIGSGTLKSKSGDTVPATLVVSRDGKDYKVNVDDKTQLRRRFWGKAILSEFQVGDSLNVIGRWTDDAHTTINAVLIRDISIQKKFSVFVGKVTSLTGTGIVIDTIHRGSQAVTISSSTKLVNRKGETIIQADIKIGDTVRVRGLWDSKANTITETTAVKDYSLPPKS